MHLQVASDYPSYPEFSAARMHLYAKDEELLSNLVDGGSGGLFSLSVLESNSG